MLITSCYIPFQSPWLKKKEKDLLFQKLLLSRNFQTEQLRHGPADTLTTGPRGSPWKCEYYKLHKVIYFVSILSLSLPRPPRTLTDEVRIPGAPGRGQHLVGKFLPLESSWFNGGIGGGGAAGWTFDGWVVNKRPFGYALPEKRRPQEVASLKLGSSPFPPLTMPPPRARVDPLPRCVWNRVAELFGEIRRMQARKEAEPRGGGLPAKAASGLVGSRHLCVCSGGADAGQEKPRPRELVAAAKHKARGALRSVESRPGSDGGRSTALALNQWAGVLPGRWPRPRALGAPLVRLALRPWPPPGGPRWGLREGLSRVQTLKGGPAEDGTLEKVKEKEQPSVRAASSSHRVAWAARGAGLVPGRRSGHRVAGSAWDGRGGPWPQASLGRGPERGSGSPG